MKGTIAKSTGSWYSVFLENGGQIDCRLKGIFRLKGIKDTNPIAVGDNVEVEPESDGKGLIVKLYDRKNFIVRKATNLSRQSHIIAANIDQALLIVTIVAPRTSLGFIDRFLVTAEAYCIPVKIVFNKTDIYNNELNDLLKEYINIYTHIGYECCSISAENGTGIDQLKAILNGNVSLLSGHSGVGKSTLINCIAPALKLKVGDISATHFKGTHTTTFAEMFKLENNSYIIDTPGIKEFGMIDMNKEDVSHYFPEMFRELKHCKFNNCLHLNEPGCAVIKAVEKGKISPTRYNTYLGIMNGEELDKVYDN